MHDEKLSSILSDIINGYTILNVKFGVLYVKHLNFITEVNSSRVYQYNFDKYKNNGLPTRDERLEFLIKEEEWSKEDDSFIEKYQSFLKNLKETKSKLVIKSQIDDLNKTIKETEQKVIEKIALRERLIGATCEKYAFQKKEEHQIISLCFKDKQLTEPYLTEEESEYADSDEIRDLFSCYYSVFSKFSEDNLKKIAVSPIFYNFFSLIPKENPASFFRFPIHEITFFQQRLLHYAQNVRYISENTPDIPDEIRNNYEALIDFSKRSSSSNLKHSKDSKAYSVVGASKDDLSKAGVDQKGSVSPFDILRKSGKKSLNKRDFFDIK